MNILVFGASGRTGRELVKQALAQGQTVTAFVRHPASFDLAHPQLKVVQGTPPIVQRSKARSEIRMRSSVRSARRTCSNGTRPWWWACITSSWRWRRRASGV